MKRFILAVSLGCAFATPATAAPASSEPFPLSATSATEFRQQASHLRSEMESGRYAGLKPAEKARINDELNRLDTLYARRAEGAAFTDADAVTLVNASSAINTTLLGDEDQRMVCEHVKTVGSNRAGRVCMTAAERRELQRNTDRDLRDRRAFGQ